MAASGSAPAADPLATTDLGTLLQQFARRSHSDLAESLQALVEPQDAAGQAAAREGFMAVLQRSRAGLLRISMLIESSMPGKALEAGLEEARRVQILKQHATQVRRCGDGDRMGREREFFVGGLATRQHDVDGASALLRGQAPAPGGDGATGGLMGDLSEIGWSEGTTDVISSVGGPFVTARSARTQERSVLSTWLCLAESELPKDPDRFRIELLEHGECRIIAPGAFVIRAAFDQRWVVMEASVHAGRGHEIVIGPQREEVLRKRLQKAADSCPANVPRTISEIAHSFCSDVWLNILYNGALALSLEKKLEVGNVRMDQKANENIDRVRMNVCLQWDPTCGGFLKELPGEEAGISRSKKLSEDKLMNAPTMVLPARKVAKIETGGCLLRLLPDPEGGLRVETHPDLSLPAASPQALEASCKNCLEDLLAGVRKTLASWHLGRLHAALLEPAGAGEPSGPELVEKLEADDSGEASLRVVMQGCALQVRMAPSGATLLSTDGWMEGTPQAASGPRAGQGRNGFIARLEAGRWEALAAAVRSEASARNWEISDCTALEKAADRPAEKKVERSANKQNKGWAAMAYKPEPEEETTTSATGPVAAESRLCAFHIRVGSHPLALCLELKGAEVLNPMLCVVAEGRSIAEQKQARVNVPGMVGFSFISEGTRENGLSLLRQGVARLMDIAQKIGERIPFTGKVLQSLAKDLPTSLAPRDGSVIPWTLTVRDIQEAATRVEVDVRWECDAGPDMPFTMPLKIIIDEAGKRWGLQEAALRQEMRLISEQAGASIATLASGCQLRAKPETVHGRQVVKKMCAQFGASCDWSRWPSDLKALAMYAEVAAQAVNSIGRQERGEAALEVCGPFKLRWKLPGWPGGEDEVFELILRGQSKDVPAVCSFQWVQPKQRFLLAGEMSRMVCESRKLKSTLQSIGKMVELVRIAEELASDPDEEWTIRGTSATTVAVEYSDRCLGVEIEVVAPGAVKCIDLSTKTAAGQKGMATLPNFEEFVQLLSARAAPDGTTPRSDNTWVAFEPGKLRYHLAPLWSFVRNYRTLFAIHVKMSTQEGEEGGATRVGNGASDEGNAFGQRKLVSMRAPSITDPLDKRNCWTCIDWVLPPLSGAGCALELLTKWAGTGAQDGLAPAAGRNLRGPLSRTAGRMDDQGGRRVRPRLGDLGAEDQGGLPNLEVFLNFQGSPPLAAEYPVVMERHEIGGLRVEKAQQTLVTEDSDEKCFADINKKNPDAHAQMGDEIVEVNSIRGNAQHLYEAFRKAKTLRMRWRRRADADRADAVLERFTGFFKEALADRQTSRPKWLAAPLTLLRAPQLWVHEEVSWLLPPMMNSTGWEPLASCFDLGPCDDERQAEQDGRKWRLAFTLVPEGARPETKAGRHIVARSAKIACLAREAGAGWEKVWVDDKELKEWVKDIPDREPCKQQLLQLPEVFSIIHIWKPLVQGLTVTHRPPGQ